MTTLTDELGMVMIETEDNPAPVTVPEGDDPIAVLRTMQAFMAGTDRGVCEILDPHRTDGRDVWEPIGLTVLIGHPERISQPVYDYRTRVVEVVELVAWLKARGYEASACQWERPDRFAPVYMPETPRWKLITGKAQLPPMPTAAPDAAQVQQMAQAAGSLLSGTPGIGLGALGLGPLKGR